MSIALVNHIQKQIAATENTLYDLHIDLQKAESEMATVAADNDDCDEMDISFSEIWDATRQPQLNANAPPFYPPLKAEAPPFYHVRPEGTKLKWVSSTNSETYRVAIVKKDGILEVKRVTDGTGYCHDTTTCRCKPCNEVRVSGGQLPPWMKGAPLIKTFFATALAWHISLPFGGKITVTEPQPSDRALKELCMKPLTATTDAGRLKELEERFPGATMVLSTQDRQYVISYKEDPVYGNIHCEDAHISGPYFANFGSYGKTNLMAEWRGLYIDLSHLF